MIFKESLGIYPLSLPLLSPLHGHLPMMSKEWLESKNEEELEDLEDDRDLDDDRFLEEYRKKRLEELRASAKVSRFGSVMPIIEADYVREVSQAPSDVWVVLLLYKDGIPQCTILLRCLEELAERYPLTKFVKIISTECGPNPYRMEPYTNIALGVALTLCQSNPVLGDSSDTGDSSKKAVMDGVRRRFIERVLSQHEDDDSGDSSD